VIDQNTDPGDTRRRFFLNDSGVVKIVGGGSVIGKSSAVSALGGV
jgi:hypothetical protein